MGGLGLLAVVGLVLVLWARERAQTRRMRALAKRHDDTLAARQSLLRARAHMDDFVATVGHELRTPMGAILGLNAALRQELVDRPQDVEVVDRIRQAAEALLQLADKMLEYARLQAGQVQLYPRDFDLSAALRELMAHRQAQAQHKGLAWVLDGVETLPQQVHMDRQRLQQVLGELLDNAIQHTTRGQVVLRVQQADGRLHCEVQDTGAGIALARQATLFNAFDPAAEPPRQGDGEGSGLGLMVCAQWVRRMGGEIGVRSAPGQGATFWLDLPLAPAGAAALPQPKGIGLAPDTPLDILLVDDNEVNRMVARMQLQKTWPQARIATAYSAAQALQMLERQGFDVALVDVLMPDMDGVALTQQIRRHVAASTACMPIIALTANTDAQERERCLAAGMDEVLHKPMDTLKLQRCVGVLVAQAQGGES